jgi:RND family efflux transporter MFP subunit
MLNQGENRIYKYGLTYLIQLLILLLLPSTIFAADDRPSIPVEIVKAVQVEIFSKSWLPGTVIGRHDSRIAAEVEGKLEEVLDVGDRVKKGEPLARIEAFTLNLHVDEMQAEILPKEARRDFLGREVKRLSKLAAQNNAPKNRLDEVSSQEKQTRGELKVAWARLAQAKDRLARTVLYAPFDGVVTERYKSLGERVESGEQVIRLVDTNNLEIQVRVPQGAINNIVKGEVLLVKDGNQTDVAHLRTYVPVGDERSRLYELRLSFNQTQWMSGHAVRVSVPTSKPRLVTAVPRDALVIRQNIISVFRINKQNIAEYIAVELGGSRESLIEVIGEISAGDKIVVRGNERLRPGQSVQIQIN